MYNPIGNTVAISLISGIMNAQIKVLDSLLEDAVITQEDYDKYELKYKNRFIDGVNTALEYRPKPLGPE